MITVKYTKIVRKEIEDIGLDVITFYLHLSLIVQQVQLKQRKLILAQPFKNRCHKYLQREYTLHNTLG